MGLPNRARGDAGVVVTRLALLLVLIAACDDTFESSLEPDAAPTGDHTWGEASDVWNRSWCDLTLRCIPDWYASNFGTDYEACLAYVRELNTGYEACRDKPYPHAYGLVEQCAADMATQSCAIHVAPQSCYTAFVGLDRC